jgi:sugar O-acyltransferase (sialic acid O-acetyltransferase NeuD family)
MPGAILNANAVVGSGVIINTRAVVEHDCNIDDASHVSPGAVLTGNVRVGRLAWIGGGAVILPGVRIGERAIVGAGAVVLKDVEAGVTVAGNPARVLRGQGN